MLIEFNALKGQSFTCVAFSRCLCKSNVKRVKENDYSDIFLLVNTGIVSFDNQCYICLTCHRSLKKSTLPYQAVANNLLLKEVPKDISTLNILELICQRLLFKKIVIMPKGQFLKLKGATVNVSVNFSETIKKLTCIDGLILLKLKKKLSFRGHVYFEPVSRTKLLNALIYLKINDPWHYNITTDVSEIPSDLISFSDELIDFSVNTSSEEPKSQDFEEYNNPLDSYRQASNGSLIMDNSVLILLQVKTKKLNPFYLMKIVRN